MKRAIIFYFIYGLNLAHSQGLNHVWKLGYGGWFDKGVMTFDTNAYQLNIEHRPQGFAGTEASICDSLGNLLMSSNGVWIANATGDTMDNGAGLNPGQNVNAWPNGLLNGHANIFLPYPGDTNKYVLFHHTDTFDGISYIANELFYSVIDITLDSGRGSVISKNNIAFSDTLNWGIGACKHANGRDWWVVMSKHNSSILKIVLFTPNGIQSVSNQILNFPKAIYNVSQLTFSKMGDKFISTSYDTATHDSYLNIFHFDRCNGLFSSEQVLQLTSGYYLFGISFSPNGEFAYASGSTVLFQVNTTTLNVDTIAIYDGFYDPPNAYTTFGKHYLAANGHIYLTSMGSALRIHEISAPDSAYTLCNFQQHNIFLNFWNFRAVPNHPNYYLGCDTTLGCGCATSYNQYAMDDSKFNIYPNPNNGNFNIGYKAIATTSKLRLIDVNGKTIYTQTLPPWSNEQSIKCMLTKGVYVVRIENGSEYVSRKMIVMDY